MADPTLKSKKQFGTNCKSSKPPEHRVFFLDRCLGRNIVADALRRVGEEVRIHDDCFPADTKDEVWLYEVGKKQWIVLTKDVRIRYRELQFRAVRTAAAAVFVLSAKQLSGPEMADIFVRELPRIKAFLATHRRPFIARIPSGSTGKILQLA